MIEVRHQEFSTLAKQKDLRMGDRFVVDAKGLEPLTYSV